MQKLRRQKIKPVANEIFAVCQTAWEKMKRLEKLEMLISEHIECGLHLRMTKEKP